MFALLVGVSRVMSQGTSLPCCTGRRAAQLELVWYRPVTCRSTLQNRSCTEISIGTFSVKLSQHVNGTLVCVMQQAGGGVFMALA
jgi:hypothetical protein